MGITESVAKTIVKVIFLPKLPENPHFLNLNNSKANTFNRQKKPKTNISECFDI
ncbi:MAG: hypothetical protein F6K17_11570 [Okeania sp. SIO3C4]|nr:hypothetical protein [Okeania sp. SIO3C4]